MVIKKRNKIQILWSLRKWPLKYINWRLITAYPSGWKYVLKHPFIFIKDFWNYLEWNQMMENYNNENNE